MFKVYLYLILDMSQIHNFIANLKTISYFIVAIFRTKTHTKFCLTFKHSFFAHNHLYIFCNYWVRPTGEVRYLTKGRTLNRKQFQHFYPEAEQ